ncbi:Pollen Ole e 1 allergen and extensin family protein [Zostera marina]|uniref:Pollen Ole e 1 allergen and extensin family protein n=1 Tax=Zostera marina TaxID=29655 RepID=A0A0K9NJN5_ZOSMR|nr:Pollen Ole e 1 allergen and extensin family protein [Zostera marina]
MMKAATTAAVFLIFLSPFAHGSRSLKTSFIIKGKVFCDTCRAGFETPASTYISGATVKVECRDRMSGDLKYTVQGKTDVTGVYNLVVKNDHKNHICESSLVSSPDSGCAEVVSGRDRSRIVLTYENGIPSSTRLANSMGFQMQTALAGCAQVMKMYRTDEDRF